MRRIWFCFLLVACHARVPLAPPPPPAPLETLDAFLQRTEGVNCADITYHDYEPAPDCRQVYEACVRGRNRVARLFPEAMSIRLSMVNLTRPELFWIDEKPYPLIKSGKPVGDPGYYERGRTIDIGGMWIFYAYPQVLEHEWGHAAGLMYGRARTRTPEAIAADDGGFDPAPSPFPWAYIFCHNTPDDPLGDGPARNRGGCVAPYDGPPRPKL